MTPATFTDNMGRSWSLNPTMLDVRRLKAEFGVDPAAALLTGGGLAAFLFGDPEKLAAGLWLLVKDQATTAGVSEDDFFAAIDGPALERAAEAMLAASAGLFPRSSAGQAVRDNLPAALAAIDAAVAKTVAEPAKG